MTRITTCPPHPPAPHLIASAAAALLDIAPAGITNLTAAGILSHAPDGYPRSQVEDLAALPLIHVEDGEITVLRTTGAAASDSGVHVGMSDHELAERSLCWWRGDVARMVRAQVFVVTVSTIPVAVYWLRGCVASRGSGLSQTHHLDGELIAHRERGVVAGDELQREMAATIMSGRILTPRGGPIAYVGQRPV